MKILPNTQPPAVRIVNLEAVKRLRTTHHGLANSTKLKVLKVAQLVRGMNLTSFSDPFARKRRFEIEHSVPVAYSGRLQPVCGQSGRNLWPGVSRTKVAVNRRFLVLSDTSAFRSKLINVMIKSIVVFVDFRN